MTNIRRQKPAVHFTGILQGRSYQATVMDVGSCCRHSQRNALTVHMQMDFAAASRNFRAPTSFGSDVIFLRKRYDRVHIKLTKQIDTFPVKIGSILKFTDIRFKES